MIIEVAGAPCTGKTLLCASLERAARNEDVVIYNFHGGGRYIPSKSKMSPTFNLAVVSRNLYHLLSASSEPDAVYIFDRGIIDALIFTWALGNLGLIAPGRCAAIENILDDPIVYQMLDHVVLLAGEPVTLVERERHHDERLPFNASRKLEFFEALTSSTQVMTKWLSARLIDHQLIHPLDPVSEMSSLGVNTFELLYPDRQTKVI